MEPLQAGTYNADVSPGRIGPAALKGDRNDSTAADDDDPRDLRSLSRSRIRAGATIECKHCGSRQFRAAHALGGSRFRRCVVER